MTLNKELLVTSNLTNTNVNLFSKRFLSILISLVQGDYKNKEDLAKAFKGAKYVFANTNFWDPNTMGQEKEIGKLIADEAKKA